MGQQNNFARDLSLFKHLVGARRIAKRKASGNERLNLAFREQLEELDQILAEPVRMGVAERFDVVPGSATAVGNQFHQAQQSKSQSCRGLPFRDSRLYSIANKRTAAAKAAKGIPPVFPADGIEDGIQTFRHELADAVDEIFVSIVNGGSAERE